MIVRLLVHACMSSTATGEFPPEIHLCIRRYDIKDIPEDEAALTEVQPLIHPSIHACLLACAHYIHPGVHTVVATSAVLRKGGSAERAAR